MSADVPLAVALVPCGGSFYASRVSYSGPLWQCMSGPGSWATLQARTLTGTVKQPKGKDVKVEGILYADHDPTPAEWDAARRVLLAAFR